MRLRVEALGLKVYGSPWQPRYLDWAFNADEPELAGRWGGGAAIPEGTDVLLLHGPPRGYADFSPVDGVHTGSPSLLRRIEEVRPRLAVAGHIHSGYGVHRIGETVFVSASHVDDAYRPVNPSVVDL